MGDMKISEIVVGERFREDVGDLSSLVRSIREVGLLHPIVVSEKKELIAGYRRLKAAIELDWSEIEVKVVDISLLLDQRRAERDENVVRVDFTPSEAVAVAEFFEAEEKAKAKQRQKEGIATEKIPGGNFPQGVVKGKTRDVLGSYVGLSGKTLEKAKVVVEAAEKNPEKFGKLVAKMDAGKLSINAAATQVRRAQKHTDTPKLPEGEFDVLYADPPWKYDFCLEGDAREHYAELSTKEICELSIPSAPNAMLFLWATNPKIEDALKVVKAWGFRYVTNLVWVKQSKGLGYYSLAQHELLFICKKGDMPPPEAENRVPSVVFGERTQHSKKPEKFYQIIESMYPNRAYLELFARNSRKNWLSWGNENASKP